MSIWEALGRVVVSRGTAEHSEKISELLTFSGLNPAVNYDEAEDEYVVTVPTEQRMQAISAIDARLLREFTETEESVNYRANLARSPIYVRPEDKYHREANTAFVYLLCGGLVFALAVFQIVGMFVRKNASISALIWVELAFGVCAVTAGFVMLRRANTERKKIRDENNFTLGVIEWFISTYSPDQMDYTIRTAADPAILSPEDMHTARLELIRCYISREFEIDDPAYLHHLVEETYTSIFETQKLAQAAGRRRRAPKR